MDVYYEREKFTAQSSLYQDVIHFLLYITGKLKPMTKLDEIQLFELTGYNCKWLTFCLNSACIL